MVAHRVSHALEENTPGPGQGLDNGMRTIETAMETRETPSEAVHVREDPQPLTGASSNIDNDSTERVRVVSDETKQASPSANDSTRGRREKLGVAANLEGDLAIELHLRLAHYDCSSGAVSDAMPSRSITVAARDPTRGFASGVSNEKAPVGASGATPLDRASNGTWAQLSTADSSWEIFPRMQDDPPQMTADSSELSGVGAGIFESTGMVNKWNGHTTETGYEGSASDGDDAHHRRKKARGRARMNTRRLARAGKLFDQEDTPRPVATAKGEPAMPAGSASPIRRQLHGGQQRTLRDKSERRQDAGGTNSGGAGIHSKRTRRLRRRVRTAPRELQRWAYTADNAQSALSSKRTWQYGGRPLMGTTRVEDDTPSIRNQREGIKAQPGRAIAHKLVSTLDHDADAAVTGVGQCKASARRVSAATQLQPRTTPLIQSHGTRPESGDISASPQTLANGRVFTISMPGDSIPRAKLDDQERIEQLRKQLRTSEAEVAYYRIKAQEQERDSYRASYDPDDPRAAVVGVETRRLAEPPGSRREICDDYFMRRACTAGDQCCRIHVDELRQDRDSRAHVHTKVTQQMRDQYRSWRDDHGPLRELRAKWIGTTDKGGRVRRCGVQDWRRPYARIGSSCRRREVHTRGQRAFEGDEGARDQLTMDNQMKERTRRVIQGTIAR